MKHLFENLNSLSQSSTSSNSKSSTNSTSRNNPRNDNQIDGKFNGLSQLIELLAILNNLRKIWTTLPVAKKLPTSGYRLISLRPSEQGYTLTIFVDNSAIETKFNNLMPSILAEISNFSISQVNIKIRKNISN